MRLASSISLTVARAAGLLATAAAVAAFAGCGSSSDSSGSSTASGGGSQITASTGTEIFQAAGCKGCHTLAAEGATGVRGPNLDQVKPPAAEVVEKVTNGDGPMPSFKSRLTTAQIQTLADYVSKVAGQ